MRSWDARVMTYTQTLEAIKTLIPNWEALPKAKKEAFTTAINAYKRNAPISEGAYDTLCKIDHLAELESLYMEARRGTNPDYEAIGRQMRQILETLPNDDRYFPPYDFYTEYAYD